VRSIDWVEDGLDVIDQTKLPHEVAMVHLDDVESLVAAIKNLAVRGAPALGVVGAFGVAIAAARHHDDPPAFEAAVESIRSARPTAVNLARMVDRAASFASQGFDRILAEAFAIQDEELAASISIGEYGADLVGDLSDRNGVRAMTICNTGGLATVERGTALAVIQTLFERGRLEEALALETRPLLQGGRLTTWELAQMGAPFRLLVDSAGPFLLSRHAADIVLVGADRIARNGDTANKIGTFSLAVAARYAGVPFIVVAPESTVDSDIESGEEIVIEDRGSDEVVSVRGIPIAPPGTRAINPAFDVTPVDLITALVTDRRVIRFDQHETIFDTQPGPLRRPHRDIEATGKGEQP